MKKPSVRAVICLLFATACFCSSAFTACKNKDAPASHAEAVGVPSKKGVCLSRYNPFSAASSLTIGEKAEKINDLNVGWYYDWGLNARTQGFDADYVPMVWGAGTATERNLQKIKTGYENGTYTHLLTFNEPDLADQANMPLDEVLSLWSALEETGIPLSSPAYSSYDEKSRQNPLDLFMSAAQEQGRRVDFIAVHIYQDFSLADATETLKTKLETIYARYRLPVWVTEIGAVDIQARDAGATEHTAGCTSAGAANYIRKACAVMERLGFVERYAWFVDNYNETGDKRPWDGEFSALYSDGDELNERGRTYAALLSAKPLYLSADALPAATAKKRFSHAFSARGGTGDYVFSTENDDLPAGMVLSKDGILSGKPEERGTFSLKITVTDENKQSTWQIYRLTVS